MLSLLTQPYSLFAIPCVISWAGYIHLINIRFTQSFSIFRSLRNETSLFAILDVWCTIVAWIFIHLIRYPPHICCVRYIIRIIEKSSNVCRVCCHLIDVWLRQTCVCVCCAFTMFVFVKRWLVFIIIWSMFDLVKHLLCLLSLIDVWLRQTFVVLVIFLRRLTSSNVCYVCYVSRCLTSSNICSVCYLSSTFDFVKRLLLFVMFHDVWLRQTSVAFVIFHGIWLRQTSVMLVMFHMFDLVKHL